MNTLEAIQEVFGNIEMSEKWLEKQFEFAALVRNLEREACAKVSDRFIGSDLILEAIRARGQA